MRGLITPLLRIPPSRTVLTTFTVHGSSFDDQFLFNPMSLLMQHSTAECLAVYHHVAGHDMVCRV